MLQLPMDPEVPAMYSWGDGDSDRRMEGKVDWWRLYVEGRGGCWLRWMG